MPKLIVSIMRVFLFVMLLFAMALLHACVSKRTYLKQIKYISILKQDSAKLSYEKSKMTNELKLKGVQISNLEYNISNHVRYFDSTVNSIIIKANKGVDSTNEQYRRIMINQIRAQNNQLGRSLKNMFADAIGKKHMIIKNNDDDVQVIINIDSLYNRESLSYNKYGSAIIAIFNSAEFSNITQQYRKTIDNVIKYENPNGQVLTSNVMSVILEDFLNKTETVGITPSYMADELPESYSKFKEQSFVINFTTGFRDLNKYYIKIKAVNGVLVEERNANYVSAENNIRRTSTEMSVFYSVLESDKYLIYPSDYKILGFDDATEAQVLTKLKKLRSSPLASVIKMSGNDKMVIKCNCDKAVIVVHNNRVLKKYPRRRVDCDTSLILN